MILLILLLLTACGALPRAVVEDNLQQIALVARDAVLGAACGVVQVLAELAGGMARLALVIRAAQLVLGRAHDLKA